MSLRVGLHRLKPVLLGLHSGVVLLFGVGPELGRREVDFAEVPGAVTLGLVVEVRGGGVAAFASGGYGACVDLGPELYNGYEAVAAAAVPFFRAGVGAGAERGQRTPHGR